MNLPMFTWSCVVALVMLFIIVKVMSFIRQKNKERRFLEMGNEFDEFFIPGDSKDDYEL